MTPGVSVAIVGDLNDEQSTDDSSTSWVSQAIFDRGFNAHNLPSPTIHCGTTIDRVYIHEVKAVDMRITDCMLLCYISQTTI
jgi:hypothetical protein